MDTLLQIAPVGKVKVDSFVVFVSDTGCFRPVVHYHPDPETLKSVGTRKPVPFGVRVLTLYDPKDLLFNYRGALARVTIIGGGPLKTSSTIDKVLSVTRV